MATVASGRRALIAIDGVDGSGKTTFARALADHVGDRPTIVLHADDFLNVSAIRHARGRTSPEGFWLDSYNYAAMREFALEPLGRRGSGLYRSSSYDSARDIATRGDQQQSSDDALVLVEGLFLHRDEMLGFWDYSIFLDVPFSETARRMAERNGSHRDPEHPSMRRYVVGQRLYFAAARPWERANLVIDNSQPDEAKFIEAIHSSAAMSVR